MTTTNGQALRTGRGHGTEPAAGGMKRARTYERPATRVEGVRLPVSILQTSGQARLSNYRDGGDDVWE